MGNRKLPFGYQMRFGDVIPHPDEAEAVQKIYQNYLAGASFRQIAEGLQAQGIPYDGAKPWNKNMVARILEMNDIPASAHFRRLFRQSCSEQCRTAEYRPHQRERRHRQRRSCESSAAAYRQGMWNDRCWAF